jgi:uncharacterized protein YndB with AHSA1/START domain
MTTNKDFKRLVRARMAKTGESYTAARSHFNGTGSPRAVVPSGLPAVMDYEKLSGISNATIKAKTGCDWKKWTDALDYVRAHEWTHTEIARYVREKFKISGWWSQSVTVGYERIKKLRAIGQRRGGDFEVSKSKTFNAPMTRLYAAFSNQRNRNKWLGPVDLKVGATIKGKSMRMIWPDGKPVVAWFVTKGPRKNVVSIAHQKLPDKATAERVKAEWSSRLEKLAELLN